MRMLQFLLSETFKFLLKNKLIFKITFSFCSMKMEMEAQVSINLKYISFFSELLPHKVRILNF